MTIITPVILCGGAGSRLWPESRGNRAKQFMSMEPGAPSLYSATLSRVADRDLFEAPWVVCGEKHALRVQTDSPAAIRIIVEPSARNTAAAIALAVAAAEDDDILLIMPSDHCITDDVAFHAALRNALPAVADDWIVTFGITPDRAETGYGYIAAGTAIDDAAAQVDRFVEKPSAERAAEMLAAGGHWWNAGIFLFRAGSMRAALERHSHAVLAAATTALRDGQRNGTRFEPAAEPFAAAPSLPIDIAVMERHDRVAVVPVSMGWSDIGSWQVMHSLGAADDHGSVLAGDVLALDSTDLLVRAGGKRVSVLGLKGVAVIVDGDDIAIFPLDRAQEVRRLAAERARDAD